MVDFDTTEIHEALSTLRTRPLFVMRRAVSPIISIGAVANSAIRRIGVVSGGQFAGANPIAGRIADLGYSRRATAAMMWLGSPSLIVTRLTVGRSWVALAVITSAAITLDFAAAANLVFSQRAIYALGVSNAVASMACSWRSLVPEASLVQPWGLVPFASRVDWRSTSGRSFANRCLGLLPLGKSHEGTLP